jgi:hypothetical protein
VTTSGWIGRTAAAAAILSMPCADASAQSRVQTVTECGRSAGYAYYFSGGRVPADKSGMKQDGVDGGRIILNVTDSDLDILLKDATGTTQSVKAGGGKIILRGSNNNLLALMVVYDEATTENYVFQLDRQGDGTVVWTTVRTAGQVNKMSLMTSQCRGPR